MRPAHKFSTFLKSSLYVIVQKYAISVSFILLSHLAMAKWPSARRRQDFFLIMNLCRSFEASTRTRNSEEKFKTVVTKPRGKKRHSASTFSSSVSPSSSTFLRVSASSSRQG